MTLVSLCVGLLTLGLTAGFMWSRMIQAGADAIQADLYRQLLHVDYALASFMGDVEGDVTHLAANELVRTRDDASFTNFLDADEKTFQYTQGDLELRIIEVLNGFRLTHPHVSSVYMGRENGSFVRSHPRASPTQYDPRERPWYKLAKENPSKVMRTEPYKAVTTSDINIGVVTALVDDTGEFFGVIGADITLADLTEYISGFDIGRSGQLLLVDEHGAILASRDETLLLSDVGALLGEHAGALLRQGQGDIALGESRIYFYTSPKLGWRIAAIIPERVIAQEMFSVVAVPLIAISIALVLLIAATLAFLNALIIAPLQRLNSVTQDIIRTGNLRQQVDVNSSDEIGSLATSFNRMVESLEEKERAIRASEAKYRDLVESAGQAIFVVDGQGVFQFVNHAAARSFARQPTDLIGKTMWELFPTEFADRQVEQVRRAIETGVPLACDARTEINDEIRVFATTLQPLKNQTGEIDSVLGIASDITEHKQAEEQIRRRSRELVALNRLARRASASLSVDQVAVVALEETVAATGSDLTMLYRCEEGGLRLLGMEPGDSPYGQQEAIAGILSDRLCKRSAGDAMPLYLSDTQTDVQDELGPLKNAGLHALAVLSLRSGDRVIGVLGLASSVPRDFAEQAEFLETIANELSIALENALLYEEARRHASELQRRVAERTAELEVAMKKAQEADQLKSAFLATMSHELRTPLNSIIGFTGVILQGLAGPLNDEQRKQLGMIQNSGRHLLELIGDVLDVSKIEAGQLEIESRPFDMRASIERAVKTITPLADKKGLPLVTSIDPDVSEVTSDRRRVEQIIINLLSNAVKFTEAGEVRIECQMSDGWLVTRVIDTGIGIHPENVSKLFEPFQQVDNGLARRHEGTGLGLSICKKLVGLLGGEIWMESEPGLGSTFTFTLPV